MVESLVTRARDGDADAYADLVRRFQDMAVGYGYGILRDFQLAEDAAQEAFFEAYRNLSKLREPAAFPGWFRRIVFKQCDRIMRRHTLPSVSIEHVVAGGGPLTVSRRSDPGEIREAVNSLPEVERQAILLFYISGYSQQEIASFLDVPVSTIKGRLFSARAHLRELLLDKVEDDLRSQRPSRNNVFANSVIDLLEAARSGDLTKVKSLLEQDPRLMAARDPMGNTALIMAVNSGHHELAAMLMDAGVQPDIHEASAIGDTNRVDEFLRHDPALVNTNSPEGFPPLALAAHFGHIDTVRFLLQRGADIDQVAKHPLEVTPLHAALFGRKTDVALLLILSGADVNAARGGKGWPRAGWTPLHYSAGFGFTELLIPLLYRGADTNGKDEEGKTPLQVGERFEMVQLMITLWLTGAAAQVDDFFTAITKGDVAKVQELVRREPSLARATDKNGVSAVLKATYYGQKAVADALLATGIELNIFEASATGQSERVRALLAKDSSLVNAYAIDGFFALGLATFFGHKDTVEVLLAAGAAVNMQSRDTMKVSPLHSAAAARRPDIAALLLDHGAEPNVHGVGGFAPLHEAAATGQLDLIKLLLARHADINIKDDAGKTPLDYALDKKKPAAAELLRRQ